MANNDGIWRFQAVFLPDGTVADYVGVGHKLGTKSLWLVNEDGDQYNLAGGGGGGLSQARYEIDDTDSPFTITAIDDFIFADTDAGDITINLLVLSITPNKQYTIKNTGSGVVTIDPSGAETIDGDTSISIPFEGDSVTLMAGSAEWKII